MLGLARMELTFFTAALMLLSFHPIPSHPLREKLGRDTAGNTDLNWPKGYFTPCNPCSARKTGLEEEGGELNSSVAVAWRLANIALLVRGGDLLPLRHFMLFFFLPLFPLFIKPSFSQPTSFLAFALPFSPVLLDKGVRVSKQLCGCLPAGQGQPTTLSSDVLNNNFVFSSLLFGRECTWKGLDLISRLDRQIIVSNRFYYRMYSIKIMWWGGLGQDL